MGDLSIPICTFYGQFSFFPFFFGYKSQLVHCKCCTLLGKTSYPASKGIKRMGILLTRQIWGIWKLRPAYSPETPNLDQNRWCFVPCDLEISWMTLENNRASLLCCFKLCTTFHSHRWIQTGVTVRKRPIWVKFDDFRAMWPWNLMDDLEKQ